MTSAGDHPTRRVHFDLGTGSIELIIEGETSFGGPEVLLDADDDLSAGTEWAADGYTVAQLLSPPEFATLVDRFETLLADVLAEVAGEVPDGYSMRHHHRFVNDAEHLAFAAAIQLGFPTKALGGLADRITEEVCRATGALVAPVWPGPIEPGGAFDDPSRFFLRVVRPGSTTDHNPPHRDAWIPRLRNALNLYLPVCGSSASSSLPVVPGSHRWEEGAIERTDGGARLGGLTYSVPTVVSSTRPLEFVRPTPPPGWGTLFSPYLIHGGARNGNPDTTRVSLEMRFWRQAGRA